MHEIKCPKCGEVFQVDESGYAELLSQVRNEAFEQELHKRAKELEDKNKSDLKMAQMQQEKSFAETISDKDKEIANKDMEIQKLKNQIAMPSLGTIFVSPVNPSNDAKRNLVLSLSSL